MKFFNVRVVLVVMAIGLFSMGIMQSCHKEPVCQSGGGCDICEDGGCK
jgi:hypothetical protein